MPIEASFHFTQESGDDYIIDALDHHHCITVADLSELDSLMCYRTGGSPIVVITRHYFYSPHGTIENEFTNAYFIGDKGSYVAVNVGNRVVPLLDYDRDYTLFVEAVAAHAALEE